MPRKDEYRSETQKAAYRERSKHYMRLRRAEARDIEPERTRGWKRSGIKMDFDIYSAWRAVEPRCWICLGTTIKHPRNRNPLREEYMCVDHVHRGPDFGVSRGLLCSKCNLALGQLDDSPANALVAAMYLFDFVFRRTCPGATAEQVRDNFLKFCADRASWFARSPRAALAMLARPAPTVIAPEKQLPLLSPPKN